MSANNKKFDKSKGDHVGSIKRNNSLSRIWSGLSSLSRVFSSTYFSSVQIIPTFSSSPSSKKHSHTLNIGPNKDNFSLDPLPNVSSNIENSTNNNINNNNNVDDVIHLTVKRKPCASKGISTSLEDELYLFVLDISIDSSIDVSDDRIIFLSSDFPLYLVYSSERATNRNQSINNMSSNVSSPYELISLLRNSSTMFMNSKANINEMNNYSNPFLINIRGESGANYLVAATKSLSKLLGEYDEYNKEIEDNSLDGGNCFCTIDNALMVADIFVLAAVRLMSDSLIETTILWNDSLNMRFSSFLQSVLHVGNSANVGESVTIKYLWCQLILRCCRLVLVIVETMVANESFYASTNILIASPKANQSNNQNNNFILSPNSSNFYNNNNFATPIFQQNSNNNVGIATNHLIKPLSDLVNAIQTLCSCVNLVKVFSGGTSSGYYAVSIIYWECCRSVIKLIKMFDGNEETMKQIKSTLIMLHSRSFNSLHMTAPSLQELHYEVNSIAAFKYTLNSTMIDDRKLINILRSYINSSTTKSLASILDNNNNDNDDDRSLGSSLSLSTISGGDSDKSPQFSFRMRILFTGLVNLLSLPDIKNSSAISYSIPEKNDWIVAIAEFLLVILSQQNLHTNKKHNRHDRRISDLIHLAPYIAKILLNTLFDWTLPSSIDWMFWAFAKKLGAFSEYLRRNLNASLKSQSTHDVSARRNKSKINGKTNSSTKSDVDVSGKSSQRSSPLKETQLKVMFQIGNKVDALCVVQNGSKRWYPGIIISVNLDGSYQIQFMDGDVKNNIVTSDMRLTKKRQSNNNTVNASSTTAVKNDYLKRSESSSIETTTEDSNIHVISEKIGRSLSQLDDAENKLEDKKSKSSSDSLGELIGHNDKNDKNKEISPKANKSKAREPSYRNPTATSQSKVATGVKQEAKINKQDTTDNNLFNRNKKSEVNSRLSVTGKIDLASDDMSVKSIQSDNLDESSDFLSENNSDDESDADDDRVFVIPSVFNTIDSEGNEEQVVRTTSIKEAVPKMVFEDLNVSGSLAHSSSNLSLSGALLRENNFNLNLNTQRVTDLSSRLLSQANSHRSFTLMDGNSSSRSNINKRKKSLPKHYLLQGIGTLQQQEDYEQDVNAPINTGEATRTKNYNVNEERNNTERTMSFLNGIPQGKRKSKKSSNSSFHRYHDDEIAFDKSLLQSLMNTYGIITVVLLQRCICDGEFLDYSCCVSSDFSSPRSIESQSVNAVQSNVLYNVREFFEISSLYKYNNEKLSISSHIAELLNQSSPSMLRLIKLLSPDYFVNCLSEHLKSGVKIGEGGFGTVFNVTCPAECGRFRQYYNCFACYKQEVCDGDSSTKNCHCGSSRYTRAKNSFAIKRIPRERSPFDSPLIYDLYNEITSLEILNGTIGVCCLEDFGISGSEYWLVMEKGGQNLSEWRHQLQDDLRENSFMGGNSSLSSSRISLLLSIYLDTCLILKSIHAADIVHFDIKCNNFILRGDPEKCHKLMTDSHRKGIPSGLIFLADFGESVPNIGKQRSHPHKLRCRGTITIQSPEMLCVSDSLSSSLSVSSSWKNYQFNGGIDDNGSFQEKVAPLNNPYYQNSSKKQSQKANIRKLFQAPTKSSDVWSMGCLLVELLTDQQLFSDRSWTDMYVTLCMEKFVQIPLDCLFLALNSLDIWIINQIELIVTSALQQDPENRISLEKLISDVLTFLEVNFNNNNTSSKVIGSKTNKTNKLDVNKIHSKYEFIRKTSSSRNKEIRNRFYDLKNQLVKLDYQIITIGDVSVSFESTAKVLKYFDNILRTHGSLISDLDNDNNNISNTNFLQFDILKKISLIDELILSCNMSTVCSHIGKLLLSNKISPHHNFTWIRIISNKNNNNSSSIQHTNKDSIYSSQEEEFESFLKNCKKDWKTFVLSLNSVSFDSEGSMDKVVSAVLDIVKHLISLNSVNPMKNVLISLDPIEISDDDVDELNGVIVLNTSNHYDNNNSNSNISNYKDFHDSRERKTTNEVFYNRQSLVVAEAISSILFHFGKNNNTNNKDNKMNTSSSPSQSSNKNIVENNAVNKSSIFDNNNNNNNNNSDNNKIVTPLRKLITCLDMEFDPEIVDYIVHAVIYKLSL